MTYPIIYIIDADFKPTIDTLNSGAIGDNAYNIKWRWHWDKDNNWDGGVVIPNGTFFPGDILIIYSPTIVKGYKAR